MVLVSIWAASQRPAAGLHLRLILSRRPINPTFVEGNCLCLEVKDGLVHSSRRKDGVLLPGIDRQLTPQQLAVLSSQLRRAGAWELSDADSNDTEAGVLYTYFEVQEGDQPAHSSSWRGLRDKSPQDRCAQVLLQAPFGGEIQTALQTL